MLKIIKRDDITSLYGNLFKDGKPCFIKPSGDTIPGPLRVTAEEWGEMCHGENVIIHHRFTMTSEMLPCQTRNVGYRKPDGTIEDYGAMFDLAISVACPSGKPKWVMFGPYERGHDRAVEKARDYLVKAGALQIVKDSQP